MGRPKYIKDDHFVQTASADSRRQHESVENMAYGIESDLSGVMPFSILRRRAGKGIGDRTAPMGPLLRLRR